MGIGAKPKPHREAGQNMVPKSTDEEQKKLPETGDAAAE